MNTPISNNKIYNEMGLVDPSGRFHSTEGLSHPDWAHKNREMVNFTPRISHGLDNGSVSHYDDEGNIALDHFLNEGWIRVKPNCGVQLNGLDYSNIELVKTIIRIIAKDNPGHTLYIDYGDQTKNIYVDHRGRPDFGPIESKIANMNNKIAKLKFPFELPKHWNAEAKDSKLWVLTHPNILEPVIVEFPATINGKIQMHSDPFGRTRTTYLSKDTNDLDFWRELKEIIKPPVKSSNSEILNNLIVLADYLDSKHFIKEANFIDYLILKHGSTKNIPTQYNSGDSVCPDCFEGFDSWNKLSNHFNDFHPNRIPNITELIQMSYGIKPPELYSYSLGQCVVCNEPIHGGTGGTGGMRKHILDNQETHGKSRSSDL